MSWYLAKCLCPYMQSDQEPRKMIRSTAEPSLSRSFDCIPQRETKTYPMHASAHLGHHAPRQLCSYEHAWPCGEQLVRWDRRQVSPKNPSHLHTLPAGCGASETVESGHGLAGRQLTWGRSQLPAIGSHPSSRTCTRILCATTYSWDHGESADITVARYYSSSLVGYLTLIFSDVRISLDPIYVLRLVLRWSMKTAILDVHY